MFLCQLQKENVTVQVTAFFILFFYLMLNLKLEAVFSLALNYFLYFSIFYILILHMYLNKDLS